MGGLEPSALAALQVELSVCCAKVWACLQAGCHKSGHYHQLHVYICLAVCGFCCMTLHTPSLKPSNHICGHKAQAACHLLRLPFCKVCWWKWHTKLNFIVSRSMKGKSCVFQQIHMKADCCTGIDFGCRKPRRCSEATPKMSLYASAYKSGVGKPQM